MLSSFSHVHHYGFSGAPLAACFKFFITLLLATSPSSPALGLVAVPDARN
jgi:hypothetical protein